ncbi:2-C-methyl-D-erythritol 4-phosphate cytidylyltransferase [Dissostichus eleginoides]|uniref:2-C-methyl-D-erythritol 4-phosphate cytidylyltransferase n=1 Tax=Dissostichus eleginoides TaxID=100907 RepID=A0AAD9CKW1_DISEL|nr:2-C-methyl-D-erythritol 4-phosphate cytidylyltransferase [Dissostichus eleginoides]
MMRGVSTAVQSQWSVRRDLLITQHYGLLHNITSGSSLTEQRSERRREEMEGRRMKRGGSVRKKYEVGD